LFIEFVATNGIHAAVHAVRERWPNCRDRYRLVYYLLIEIVDDDAIGPGE
jgi:hypothetical protein